MDAGVRVICSSDSIDTADDNRPNRLNMCQMQHALWNFYTRQRLVALESGVGALASLTSRLADRERKLAIVRSRRREVEEQTSRSS